MRVIYEQLRKTNSPRRREKERERASDVLCGEHYANEPVVHLNGPCEPERKLTASWAAGTTPGCWRGKKVNFFFVLPSSVSFAPEGRNLLVWIDYPITEGQMLALKPVSASSGIAHLFFRLIE